ncbi:MAG TPA: SMC-Scp complex subunit ScpB [Phycisphaerae bacterium]|nr:SMC-Scp complex subunit ScpB [Phycisphaerae bacterium]HRY70589.1 SMC-Scp complex subunit ScpB [Phycisphaerae bacterium]HSA28361.1 SMC-Scp complex subunit ScpB [Phycisphaerae bacterium]
MSKRKQKNRTGQAEPLEPESTGTRPQTHDDGGSLGATTGDPAAANREVGLSIVDGAGEPDVGATAGEGQAAALNLAAIRANAELENADALLAETGTALPGELPNEAAEAPAPVEPLRLSVPDDQPLDDENLAETPPDFGAGLGELSTERVVEAVLFTSDAPLTLAKIVSIMGTGSAREVRKIIQGLNKEYDKTGNSFRIEEIAGGFQMLTIPAYNTWLRRLRQSRQDSKLSPAAMETLAVVAYKQPVVRAEVESIRGVSAGETLSRLRELGLVKIVGRAEDVGRPMLYGTTKHFLQVFGLSSLEDLPAVEELQAPK